MSGSQAHSVTLTLAEWQLVYTGLSELTKAAAAVAARLQTQLAAQARAPEGERQPPYQQEAQP